MKFCTGKIENPFTPFSNGTEAMQWYGENCDRCVKAYHPDPETGWAKEATLKNYVRCGKYCKLQYWMDVGFIEGTIPDEIAVQIGKGENYGLKQTCMFFSDNDNDGYKPPKRPKPEPPNQMVMPFILDELGININKEVLELV